MATYDPAQLPEFQYAGNFSIPGAVAPNSDNAATQLQRAILQKQKDLSDQSRKNFQNQSDSLYRNYADQSRQGLSDSIKKTKSDFNSRGLLNSGKTAGAINGQRAGASADLNGARYSINSGLLQNQNTLENNAIQSGYNYAQSNPNMGQLYGNANVANSQNAVANSIAQNQMYGTIAQGAGAGLGYLAAGKNNTPNYGYTISNYNPSTTYAGSSPGPWAP